MPEEVYGRVLNERSLLITINDENVCNEQGFRKGKRCVNLIFVLKIMVE